MNRWDTFSPPGAEQLRTAPPPPLRRPGVSTPRTAPIQRPAVRDGHRPSSRLVAAVLAVDVVVATGQEWLLRSGGECAALPCSVATLGGRPALCLVLTVLAALALAGSWIAGGVGAPEWWDIVRWSALALSLIATVGAVFVAVAAAVILGAGVALMIGCARVLSE